MIMKNDKRVVEVFKGDVKINTIKHGTDTVFNNTSEYVGTLPVTINSARAENLKSYKFSGNTVQNGTPTPGNPIMPQGTGDMTSNLWNAEGFSAKAITSTHEHTDTNLYGTTISSTIGKEVRITQANYPTGTTGYQNGFFFIDVDFSKYSIGDVVTFSFDYIVDDVHAASTQMSTALYVGKSTNNITPILSSGDWKISGRLIAVITIIPDMSPYVEVRLCGNSITVKNIMLNIGQNALPYEPYGNYKIPITLNGTTATTLYLNSPLYGTGDVLDECDSTGKIARKWGKLVLDGTEDWILENTNTFRITINGYKRVTEKILISSHYPAIANVADTELIPNETCMTFLVSSSGNNYFYIRDLNQSTANALKSYLATQYATGTPVTVIYQLATPTEETITAPPLMLSKGTNIVDVDTTVSPTSVYLKWKGYK